MPVVQITLNEEANELLRSKCRKKGDLSVLVQGLILKEWKAVAIPLPGPEIVDLGVQKSTA